MAYEEAAIAIFIIIACVFIIVFIALIYSIYYVNNNTNDGDTTGNDVNKTKSKFSNPEIIAVKHHKNKQLIDSECQRDNKLPISSKSSILKVSGDILLKDSIENNKLILLEGTSEYNVKLPEGNTEGLLLNIFNNSTHKHTIISNSSIMCSNTSSKQRVLNSGEFITMIHAGKFWIITNKFGNSESSTEVLPTKRDLYISNITTDIGTELQNLLNSDWNN